MKNFKWWWLVGLPLLPVVLVAVMFFAAGEMGYWICVKLKLFQN